MKKIFCMVLSFVILLTLTACGNKDASEGQKESSDPAAVRSEENHVTGQEPDIGELAEIQQDEDQKDGTGQEMSQQEISGQGTAAEKESNESEADSLEEQEPDMDKKILVVYLPEEPYTAEDLAYYTNGRADKE